MNTSQFSPLFLLVQKILYLLWKFKNFTRIYLGIVFLLLSFYVLPQDILHLKKVLHHYFLMLALLTYFSLLLEDQFSVGWTSVCYLLHLSSSFLLISSFSYLLNSGKLLKEVFQVTVTSLKKWFLSVLVNCTLTYTLISSLHFKFLSNLNFLVSSLYTYNSVETHFPFFLMSSFFSHFRDSVSSGS